MDPQLTELAARIKTAVRDEEAEALRREQEAAEHQARGRAARDELVAELAAFANQTGFLVVKQTKKRLGLTFGKRKLDFAPRADEAVVDISYEGSSDDRFEWDDVWTLRRGATTTGLERGLEDILVDALGLPRPSDSAGADADDESAQSADDDMADATHEPPTGEEAKMGRSGTRGYKSARNLTPGSTVKDIKGPI